MIAPQRCVLRWHGGKWILAKWIITHFPKHRIYTEAFGGAASVLMQKHRSYAEVYNDLDGDVVNLFRVLRSPEDAAQLRRLLELTPFSREEFLESYDPPPKQDRGRSQAHHTLIHGVRVERLQPQKTHRIQSQLKQIWHNPCAGLVELPIGDGGHDRAFEGRDRGEASHHRGHRPTRSIRRTSLCRPTLPSLFQKKKSAVKLSSRNDRRRSCRVGIFFEKSQRHGRD